MVSKAERAAISVEVKGLKETQAALEKVTQEMSGSRMFNAVRRATLKVERSAKKNAPVNTGRLRAAITPVVNVNRTGFLGLSHSIEGVVGSNVAYAAAAEYGSKPHWAPFDAILRWVQLKRLASAKKAEGVARAIWVTIARKGTKAHPYMEPALEENRDYIVATIDGAVVEIITHG